MTTALTYDFQDHDRGKRLDVVLAREFPSLSRTRVKGLIATGKLLIDGVTVEFPAYKIKGKDLALALTVPQAQSLDVVAQEMPLNIVFEDDQVIVINKPAGLVVHPGAGMPDGTLVNGLLFHCGDSLKGIGGVQRPGIVHRIDKDTSGLLVVAKTDAAHASLSEQFADHSITREYQALVWGVPSPIRGTINANIGRDPQNRQRQAIVRDDVGKHAITHYETRASFGLVASLVSCQLETGRTHQIRVHMSHIGHGLIGDPTYGRVSKARRNAVDDSIRETVVNFPRQSLHAAKLGFDHPTRGERIELSADLPTDIEALIKALQEAHGH